MISMLEDMLKDLHCVKSKFNAELPKLKNSMGKTLKEDIKRYTPRDSGRLAESYKIKVTGNDIEVSTDVEYAPYVDNGHSTRGGSFVKGVHMYDKAINNFHVKSDRLVNDFLEQVNPFK